MTENLVGKPLGEATKSSSSTLTQCDWSTRFDELFVGNDKPLVPPYEPGAVQLGYVVKRLQRREL
jgi:hypothetical protein